MFTILCFLLSIIKYAIISITEFILLITIYFFICNDFQLPFCIIADHKTKSIVLAIRGSISLRDIFTDLTAVPEKIEAEGLPPDCMVNKIFTFLKLYSLLYSVTL